MNLVNGQPIGDFLQWDAIVVPSDAPVSVRLSAMQAKQFHGTHIVICDGVQDLADINALIALNYKDIRILTGNLYDDTNSINFPYYYGDSTSKKLTLTLSRGTTINYTKTSGYPINLESFAAADARTCSYHTIEGNGAAIIADSIVEGNDGGCINLTAAGRNVIRNLWLKSTYGYIIRLRPNTYGSWSLLNHFEKIEVTTTNKYGVYATGNSQAEFIDCQFLSNTNTCIYFDSGLLTMRDGQLSSDLHAYYVTGNSWVRIKNTYVDAGDQIFKDQVRLWIESTQEVTLKPDSTLPTVEIKGNPLIGQYYYNRWDIDPDDFLFKGIVPARDFDNIDDECSIVADVTVPGGYCTQNTNPEAKGYAMWGCYSYYRYLRRGTYLIKYRLKDTDQVANDCKLWIVNHTDSTTKLSKTVTLTANYAYYVATFKIEETDQLDYLHISVYKDTTTHNIISCAWFILEYLGSDVDDYTIGGGRQMLYLPNVGSLPSASAIYRGIIAVVEGTGGVTDTLYMCMKSAADTYSWRPIETGG